jgi:hypothetical protein
MPARKWPHSLIERLKRCAESGLGGASYGIIVTEVHPCHDSLRSGQNGECRAEPPGRESRRLPRRCRR